jgi:hypothetical protein
MQIEKREATRWIKCVCCGKMIHPFERYFQVVHDDGKAVHCLACEDTIYENNDISSNNIDDAYESERHLRSMEDFADYRAAGCTDAYWDDRDAGYCN